MLKLFIYLLALSHEPKDLPIATTEISKADQQLVTLLSVVLFSLICLLTINLVKNYQLRAEIKNLKNK